MDAKTFLDNFATIVDAPGGLNRLRELVLDLAVSGRLVGHDRAEGEGAAVVEGGAVAIADAVARGWSRRRELPDPTPDQIPFPVPESWAWARLPAVTHGLGQLTPQSDFTYIDVSSVNGEDGSLNGVPAVVPPDQAPSRARKVVERGVVLYSTIRPYLKNIVHIDRDFDPPAIASTAFAVLRPVPGVDPPYLKTCLRSSYFNRFVESRQKGVAYPAINDVDLAFGLIPVPPPAEQKRIVAKVDELMELCDELEARQRPRQRAVTRFRGSALHALTEAETPDDLCRAWERLSINWPALTNVPDSITHLRETIVQLAVEGRLTRRAPTDGSAKGIIESARGQALDQPQLVNSEGGVLPEPYDIPLTWRWVALGGVTANILAGWSPPSTHQVRSGDEWAVLKVSACSWGEFRPEENKGLQPGVVPKEELEVRPGDFLISRANTSDLVARSVVVGSTPPRLLLSDKTLRITPVDGCSSRYLNLANLAPTARAHYRAEATGTSNSMKNVSQRAIRRTPIPLPPSAEQARIVAAVDRLNRRCDDLERALKRQSNIASQLSASITP